MSDARRAFAARLLVDLIDVVSVEQREFVRVAIIAIAREIDELEREARAEGFNEDVEAGRGTAQPDAVLAELRERQDVNLQGMLEAYAQIRPDVSH